MQINPFVSLPAVQQPLPVSRPQAIAAPTVSEPQDRAPERLPAQGRSLPLQTLESATEATLSALVQARLQEPDSPWFSEEGSCMDIAALWFQDLKARGIPAYLALTDTNGQHSFVQLKDGSRPFQDKFHAFIVIETPEGDLLLDPTWKQFMADKQAVRHQPSILLGRAADFQAVYQQEQAQLQFETHGHDPRQGQYEPISATELLYSLGRWQTLRQKLN